MPDRTSRTRGRDDLLADPGWVAVPLPAAAPEVSLLRLHLDRGTRATVSLVRFPAGWARPSTVHCTATEEFVVIDGLLRVSGATYRPGGDVVVVPAGAPRSASSAPDGALALAWFSGVPEWHLQPDDCLPRTAPAVTRRVDRLAPDPAPYDRDVWWVQGEQWAYVPAGAPVPDHPGAAFVRPWPPPADPH